ncbi:hypothetical protein B0J11DRAFT_34089 [Dendryphion nanum]|uniref:Extracellular membrane protein CFEM domain-containing protein n=1 Tax=Dendryphion nanum TaxID=256645 RepID=A0A9P9EL23_9PLEO|nr:hypothetical protein B0J11DRAFT_34089 [Dendryphion nanum]
MRHEHIRRSLFPDSVRFILISFAIILLPVSLAQSVAPTISLATDKDLVSQRQCVRDCITLYGPLWKAVGGCNVDGCFCRQDLRSIATRHLRNCIYTTFSECSNGVDFGFATSIYDRYCSFSGPAPAEPSTTSTSETARTTSSYTYTTAVSYTAYYYPTATITRYLPEPTRSQISISSGRSRTSATPPSASPVSSPPKPKKKLSAKEKNIIVGVIISVFGLLIVIAGGCCIMKHRRRRREQDELNFPAVVEIARTPRR